METRFCLGEDVYQSKERQNTSENKTKIVEKLVEALHLLLYNKKEMNKYNSQLFIR